MIEEYDWDIFVAFKEQVCSELSNIEENILNLSDESLVENSIDELFRTFHFYKSNTEYLALTSFHHLAVIAESVLAILHEEKKTCKKIDLSIIKWLLQILNYINIFSQEMEMNKTLLSPVPPEILNFIQLTPSSIQPTDKLKTLNILYVDINEKRTKQISTFLGGISATVYLAISCEGAYKHLTNCHIDIIICNLNKENHVLISYIKREYKNLPIIAVFNKLTALSSKELLKKGVSHSTINPLSTKNLNRELLSIVKVYFPSSNIIIN